ncbi:MAG TPA: S-methyl-5-thioribose-1-phosphate isomerase [Streptosporangiaceae bacterium]|jgi:methylthioribose-1-phosphate isomerase
MVQVLRWAEGPGGPAVVLLDQTALPRVEREVVCGDVPALVDAVKRLVVRGAPLLGVAGAYGVALAARLAPSAGGAEEEVRLAAGALARARPTAVNLARGVERAYTAYLSGGPDAALAAAHALAAEDAAACDAMAAHGLPLVPEGARVLTHCNTGGLVTMGIGTAFGVVLAAHRAGRVAHLWVDETRPLLQGARLTAYEAVRNGIPHAVLADGAAASLFASGQVDLVIVGADRIAADGSTANKVGTYALAVLAHHHRVPFVVVAPSSTIDLDTPTGSRIIVEQREPAEVTGFNGTPTAPEGSGAYNPAFDVTPPQLIFALVSERGIAQPVNAERVARLRASQPARRDDDEAQ